MVLDISIFTLVVDNLQFDCDQCMRTNSSEKGLAQWHNICGSSNILVMTTDITILIIAVRFIKEIPEGLEKV